MEYRDVKAVVMEELYKWEEDNLSSKHCPTCGRSTTMIGVFVESPGEGDELAEDIERWRCLNCLGLFTETLQPTK